MSSDRAERLLAIVLRLFGAITLLALPAMLLPEATMAAIHRALGLGELPRAPVLEYLARSAAALYAIEGGLMLVLATDVRRYRAIVRYVGWAHVAFGVVVVAIDAEAGMPWWWTAGEGPPIVAAGVVLLLLARRVAPATDRPGRAEVRDSC